MNLRFLIRIITDSRSLFLAFMLGPPLASYSSPLKEVSVIDSQAVVLIVAGSILLACYILYKGFRLTTNHESQDAVRRKTHRTTEDRSNRRDPSASDRARLQNISDSVETLARQMRDLNSTMHDLVSSVKGLESNRAQDVRTFENRYDRIFEAIGQLDRVQINSDKSSNVTTPANEQQSTFIESTKQKGHGELDTNITSHSRQDPLPGVSHPKQDEKDVIRAFIQDYDLPGANTVKISAMGDSLERKGSGDFAATSYGTGNDSIYFVVPLLRKRRPGTEKQQGIDKLFKLQSDSQQDPDFFGLRKCARVKIIGQDIEILEQGILLINKA